MKKLLIPLLLLSVILAGCGQTSTSNISNNQTFDKKQDCNSYQNIMNSFLESKYPNADGIYVKYETLDVFYSSILNSCLYGYKAFDRLCGINEGCPSAGDYDNYVDFGIYDVLSRKETFYKRTDAGQLVPASEQIYSAKIQELKGE